MINVRRVVVLAACLVLVFASGGHAEPEKEPTDEDLLIDLLIDYCSFVEKGDVDGLLALFSKNYKDEDGTDYDTIKWRMEHIVPMLALARTKISGADARIEVENDTATLGPCVAKSPFGKIYITLGAAKEDSAWRITSMKFEY